MAPAERLESAGGRARAAWEVGGPDGRLHDRGPAAAEIAAALGELTGSDWSTVRDALRDPRSLAFRDRMHRRLEWAEPRPAWRTAMAWRWWRRHGGPEPVADRRITAIRAVARWREPAEPERAREDRVAAVLATPVRASTVVPCRNRVLRRPRSRPKRMTPPPRDLKRLYGNSHPRRSGLRKDVGPYRALGLALPRFAFGELLQADQARLTQQLSTQGNGG